MDVLQEANSWSLKKVRKTFVGQMLSAEKVQASDETYYWKKEGVVDLEFGRTDLYSSRLRVDEDLRITDVDPLDYQGLVADDVLRSTYKHRRASGFDYYLLAEHIRVLLEEK